MYYTAPGTYTVTLTATDQYGATGTTTVPVTVSTPSNNQPPAPVIQPPVCSGMVCNFSAVGTSDPNTGDALTYSWTFGDGSPNGSGVATSHTFPGTGNYTVTLTVTDGWGASSSTTRSVTF